MVVEKPLLVLIDSQCECGCVHVVLWLRAVGTGPGRSNQQALSLVGLDLGIMEVTACVPSPANTQEPSAVS